MPTHSALQNRVSISSQLMGTSTTFGCTPKVRATRTPSSADTRGGFLHDFGKQQLLTTACSSIRGSGARSMTCWGACWHVTLHRSARRSRWQWPSVTGTCSELHTALCTGKSRIRQRCSSGILASNCSIVLQFRRAERQLSGWMMTALAFLWWYASSHSK